MSQILEIATNVSTPLMIAGFLAGSFFLILRQILKKQIFPSLTKQLSADIIKLIIERLFTLSLIALVLGFAGFVVSIYANNQPTVEPVINKIKIDKTETIEKIDEEIQHRLQKIPHLITKSQKSDNPVAKGNLTSQVYNLPDASWVKPLFPEFKDRSIISLVYDLKKNVPDSETTSVNNIYKILKTMEKESREIYYVHDMYKMEIPELTAAESKALSYYQQLIQLRSQWR